MFFGDDDTITTVEPTMINFLTVLGECGVEETQKIMDTVVHRATRRWRVGGRINGSLHRPHQWRAERSRTDADLDVLYAWTAPTPAPAPCPEALFSLTLRGKLDGIETLLTVRGMTAEEFRHNLERSADCSIRCP